MNEQTKIAVFGGGRWARALLGVFLKNTESSIVYVVYTKHFAEDMRLWADKNCVDNRVIVSDGVADFLDVKYLAAVVANAVSDHKEMAENALAAKVPVLVEKPMTPSLAETAELIESAKLNNTLLVSSWVFMHAAYIDNFINHIEDVDDVQEVYFIWTDEFDASRYGERKRFDSSIPIFKDVIPHVMSILSKILKSQDFKFNDCRVSRGGSCVEISVFTSNIKCNLTLERNATKRRRKIFVKGKKDVRLDFSIEPGTICTHDNIFNGDIYWDSSPSPLEKMVMDFLTEVELDRLDQEDTGKLALSISKLIDEIEPAYLMSLDKWLIEHLNQKEISKRDIHYFLSELVRGTLKVDYDKSAEVILRYLGVISSGKLLRDFQCTNTKVFEDSIIKFIKSLNISL